MCFNKTYGYLAIPTMNWGGPQKPPCKFSIQNQIRTAKTIEYVDISIL